MADGGGKRSNEDYEKCVSCNTVSNAIFLGIEDREQIYFSVYPNPATSHVVIELPEDMKRGTIQLFNVHAQLVMQYATANQNAKIDISSLDQGLYFIHLTDGKKQGWEKFVRQ